MALVDTIWAVCVFFVPTIENGEKLCIRVCFKFFVWFSMQTHLPQLNMEWVNLYILKSFKSEFELLIKKFETCFWSNFEQIRW